MHVHIAAYKWRDITRVGTLQTEVLNRTSILLVQSKAGVISSSENKKIEFLLKTDVTVSVSVRCFLKNPSHGQVVRVRTNSPICFAAIVWGSNLNQILILLVQSEARVISSSENSKNLIFIGNWRHCLSFRQVLFEKPVSRTSCTRTYELANFFAAVVSLGLGQRLCGCVDFQVFTTFK